MKEKKYCIDMCSGPIWSKLLLFALPMIAATILQLMFNAADVIVVGKFVGDASQAAVTSTGSLVNLLIGLFSGLSVGVNVLVARALGSGDRKNISDVVHTSVVLGLVCGSILTVVGELFAPLLLQWMGSPEGVIELSALYLRIDFLGLPGTLLYNFGSALLRAQGDTRRPMYYLTLSGVVNVVLNLLFVVGFRWDVAGVAAATAITKWMSALLVLNCLIHETGPLHLDLHRLKVGWKVAGQITRIGLPAGLQGTVFSLSSVVLQSAVNSMGETVMAGCGASSNISEFVYTVGNTFCVAATTFVSQNYGAGKVRRIDRSYVGALLYGTLIPLVLGGLTVLFGPQLLGIYTNSPDVIAEGMRRMSVLGFVSFLHGFMEVTSGSVRGLGYSMTPMVVSLVGTCGLRIVWVYTVFAHFGTVESLYWCIPASWAVTGLTHFVCFLFVRRRVRLRLAREGRLVEE